MGNKGERRAAKQRRREQRRTKRRDRSSAGSRDWPAFDRLYDEERLFRRFCLAAAEEEQLGLFHQAVARYRRSDLDLNELPSDPIERAQELMFQAIEAGLEAGAALVAQALEIDPGCPEALSYRAALLEESPERACADCETAVRVARERLGPAFFEQYSGEFADHPEALPLMRCADRYRQILVKAERFPEAILSAEESLALGDSEAEDLKLDLAIWLLVVGNHASARKLLDGLDAPSGELIWAEVLERLQAGDLEAAEDGLRFAEIAYPGVQDLLTADRPMPEHADRSLPADELAAVLVARALAPAWRATAGAQGWLGQQRS
jgi:hypothetical protein